MISKPMTGCVDYCNSIKLLLNVKLPQIRYKNGRDCDVLLKCNFVIVVVLSVILRYTCARDGKQLVNCATCDGYAKGSEL